jgi:hypothetical protein
MENNFFRRFLDSISLRGTKPLGPPARKESFWGKLLNPEEQEFYKMYLEKWKKDNMNKDYLTELEGNAGEFLKTDKYYTPDISDIRVGYECEISSGRRHWITYIILPEDFHRINSYFKIRTPYLTKEQIEAEGWKETDTPEFFDSVKNDRYYLNWEPKFRWISIGDNEGQDGYSGKCPSINEFRYILRLLGI